MKLYDLTQSYRNLIDMDEEVNESVLKDTLESIQESIER